MKIWIVYDVGLDDTTLDSVRAYSTKELAEAAAQMHGYFLNVEGPIEVDIDAAQVQAGLSRFRVTVRQDGLVCSCEHLGIGTGEPTAIVIDNGYHFIQVTADAPTTSDAAEIAMSVWRENTKAPLAPT